MTAAREADHHDTTAKGLALFAAAMLCVPFFDTIAKVLGETISPIQIGFMRYAIQATILCLALSLLGRPLFVPRALLPRVVFAAFCAGLAVACLFWSFQSLPLANAIAIFFVEPLILTIFSALFLGERVGRHRVTAVAIGLVGAMVVIRPNLALYGAPTLLPLLAAIGFAGFVATIRTLTPHMDSLRIQANVGLFAALGLGTLLVLGSLAEVPLLTVSAPTGFEWQLLLVLGVLATGVQIVVTFAIRLAEASALAPLQYLEIIGATALGYIVFGEFPDTLTMVGTAIILGAGLYVAHRERIRAAERRHRVARR